MLWVIICFKTFKKSLATASLLFSIFEHISRQVELLTLIWCPFEVRVLDRIIHLTQGSVTLVIELAVWKIELFQKTPDVIVPIVSQESDSYDQSRIGKTRVNSGHPGLLGQIGSKSRDHGSDLLLPMSIAVTEFSAINLATSSLKLAEYNATFMTYLHVLLTFPPYIDSSLLLNS